MIELILRIVSIVLNFLISLWIYLFLANRILRFLKDSVIKLIMMIFCPLILISVSVLGSLFFRSRTYLYVQICITAIFAAGELHRVLLSAYYRAAGPETRISYYDSILKPLTLQNIKIYEYNIQIDKWKGKPLTIAHISDLHITEEDDIAYSDRISRKLSRYEIDYVFFTGDYFSQSHACSLLGRCLEKLCNSHPAFAVMGNHDYWLNSQKTEQILREKNIRVLKNNYAKVSMDSHTFIVSGFDKPWGAYDYSTYIFPDTKDMMHLCLSHHPDNIYKLSSRNIDAVFAGHFHAGEVRLPVFGALVVASKYNRRFTHGHFLVKKTHLFVTAGTGSSVLRTRIYCNPDIFIIHINKDEHDSAPG